MSEHDSCNDAGLDDALRDSLAALRTDAAPQRDLWAGIAARMADADLRDHVELPESLRAALLALPKDEAPAHDLWNGIAARIEVRQLRRRRRPWLAAAASLAASVVVVFGLVVNLGDAPDTAGASIAKAPLRPSAEVFAATIGRARGDADAAALRRAVYLPISREERALVRANLKIVDSAQAQIEKAMAADPDDAAYLQALLDSTRQQQQGLRAALAERP